MILIDNLFKINSVEKNFRLRWSEGPVRAGCSHGLHRQASHSSGPGWHRSSSLHAQRRQNQVGERPRRSVQVTPVVWQGSFHVWGSNDRHAHCFTGRECFSRRRKIELNNKDPNYVFLLKLNGIHMNESECRINYLPVCLNKLKIRLFDSFLLLNKQITHQKR